MPPQGTRRALVSGATGLVGGEIAATLAERGHKVWGLILAENKGHAAQRLRKRLSLNTHNPNSRISPLCGNICESLCGIAEQDLGALRKECDIIIHAAGETSFNNTQECTKTNVNGAKEIIGLARSFERLVRIFFISTASVCCGPPHSILSEDADPVGYENGYTISKREAERLMLDSGLDVIILRPTIVLSHGIADRGFARSILWVIPAMIELGIVPAPPNARLDIVPVGYVGDAVERLIRRESLRHNRYHISAGPRASVTCSDLREAACETYPKAVKTRFLDPERAEEVVGNNGLRRALLKAIGYYQPFIAADVVYSNDRLARELGEEMPVCPKATDYLKDLMAQFSVAEALDESRRP